MANEFTIERGEEVNTIQASHLSAETVESTLTELKAEASSHITVGACRVYQWPDSAQYFFWHLLALIMGHKKLRLRLDKVECPDVISAAVRTAGKKASTDKHQVANRSALYAINAVCTTPLALNAALSKLQTELKSRGMSCGIKSLRDELKTLFSPTASEAPETDPHRLAEGFRIKLRTLEQPGDTTARSLNYFNGDFYFYRGSCWNPMSDKELEARLADHLQSMQPMPRVTKKLIGDVTSNLRGQALVACGREALPFFVNDYGQVPKIARPNYIVFKNGMIDIDAAASNDDEFPLQPLTSHYFTTSRLPFEYDDQAKCPRFLRFLQHVLEVDPETKRSTQDGDRRMRVLQEYFGYTLLKDGRMQSFLVMFGDGANGKSVVSHLLEKMLGEENVSHVGLDQLGGGFALEPLIGKAANICGDLNEIDGVAEGILKQLTGQDNLTVNRKHRSAVTMQPSMKLIFATNALPRFKDKSSGVWRRLIAMPFRVCIREAEQDVLLASKLEAELPGIINWALRGLWRLLKKKAFTKCAVCEDAKNQHQEDCDPIKQFANQYLRVSEGYDSLRDEVYRAYVVWCENNGRRPPGSSEFGKRLLRLFPRIKNGCDREGGGRRRHLYRDIRLIGGTVIPRADGADHARRRRRDRVPSRCANRP